MSGKSYLPVLGDRGCPARHRLILPLRCPRGGLPQPRRLGGRWRHPAGGLPSLSPVAPAFPLLFAPIPPTPFPAGRGRFLVFLCKGLRPLHPRGWMGRGTGSTCVSATRRGLAPALAGSTCVSATPTGGLPSLPPAAHAFSFDSAPYLPSPRSQSDLPRRGRGRFLVFLCKGLPPLASPGLDGARHGLDLR